MSNLNYSDYAYDIGKIEKYLPSDYKGKLSDLIENDQSKEELVREMLSIMQVVVYHNDLDLI